MTPIAKNPRAPGRRRPTSSRRRRWWRPARPRTAIRTFRPAREAGRKPARSRACHLVRANPRRLVVDIREGALDPGVSALEELVLPDRQYLLDSFDRIA